jgi:hypothetical protein
VISQEGIDEGRSLSQSSRSQSGDRFVAGFELALVLTSPKSGKPVSSLPKEFIESIEKALYNSPPSAMLVHLFFFNGGGASRSSFIDKL